MARIELTAGEREAGARLDLLVAGHAEVGSRGLAQRLIDGGRVTVDGRARPKGHRVAVGELIAVEADARERASVGASQESEAAVRFTVVFEDDHLLVVDKPAGLVVHPGHGRERGTLAQALEGRAVGGPPERAGIVHRLDRDTSGLLVVAKSEPVHAALSEALRRRHLRRGYLALVDGQPDARSGLVDAPLGRDRVDRTLVSTRSDRPRAARTHFEVSEALARTALLELRLETGRTHQIRAHMAAIGHPVCGDRRYGGGACGSRLGLGRQFLHSARLGLSHPVTAVELAFESPLPDDLRVALAHARGERRRGAR